MDALNGQLETLLDLEARHDDLLRRLDALDKRVERVLADCLPEKANGQEVLSGPASAGEIREVVQRERSREDSPRSLGPAHLA